MSIVSRLHRPLRLLAFFFTSAALLLMLLPPVAVQALDDETGVTEIIDNTHADFAGGVFQRTVVAASLKPPTNDPPTNLDQVGGIELAPAGALNRNNWLTAAALLPQQLSDAPVVALDKYLFVIGGATSPIANEENRSPFVYRGIVDQKSGELVAQADPYPNGNDTFAAFAIEAADPGPECDTPLAGRSRAGAVAVPSTNNGTNLGYIFVIGGSMYDTDCQTYDFSTNLVQRATVNANGDIIGWSAQDSWRFPTLDDNGNIITDVNSLDLRGVQNVQVVHIRTSEGNDFIYAIGGLSVSPEQFLQEDIYPYVFYTKVDTNGNLVNPHPTPSESATVWHKLNDLPFSLHSGTAIAARTTGIESDVPVQKDAIFLLGGCTDISCTSLNTSVYRADINPTTGELTWTDQVASTGSGSSQAISIQGRQGVTGISFNNRIYYVTGSTSTGSPGAAGATATIPVAIYNDQFLLEDLTSSNNYFVGFDENNDYVLPQPNRRLNASVALVPAVPPSSDSTQVHAAWMYVIGGSNELNQPTQMIFVGRVGGANETIGTIRASEGWYYSQPFPVLTEGETSRLLAITWFTDLNRPPTNPEADIRIQFRAVVTSGTCRESDFDPSTSSNSSRWRDLDGDTDPLLRSKDGENTVRLIDAFPTEEIQATCMQYRAQFIQDPGQNSYTPKLLYFAVEKVVAAKPDILIDTFDVQTNSGSFTGITLKLKNLRNNNLSATRSVVAAAGGGGFFVDLCIAKRTNPATPVLTAVPAPDPDAGPGATPACATVSAQVPKENMTPGASYTVPFTAWLSASGGTSIDWNTIFGEPGTYDIGIVVDYNALTGEDAQGRSNNRGENVSPPNGIIRTVTITAPPNPNPPTHNTFIPAIYK
ncbi:hypothetical protein [Chloroflexus sp.]|uniref:hypothetical protein n=1 Tax=Chloroflexus sp. TaxID=1904827 RepID=UPI002ADE218D|nr:hypothetical protein [Chloroflexus sp.]